MTPLLIIAFAAFAALAWHDLRKAFLLFIAALPSYVVRFHIGSIPTTALEVLFVILFVAWMLKREKRLIDIKGWGWLLLAWIAIATVSLFVSPDFRAAAGVWKAYFIEPVLFFLIANDLLRAREDRDAAVSALACSAIVVSGMAIVQHWTGWGVPPPFNGVRFRQQRKRNSAQPTHSTVSRTRSVFSWRRFCRFSSKKTSASRCALTLHPRDRLRANGRSDRRTPRRLRHLSSLFQKNAASCAERRGYTSIIVAVPKPRIRCRKTDAERLVRPRAQRDVGGNVADAERSHCSRSRAFGISDRLR